MSAAISEGSLKTPLPTTKFSTKAKRLQRPMARTSVELAGRSEDIQTDCHKARQSWGRFSTFSTCLERRLETCATFLRGERGGAVRIACQQVGQARDPSATADGSDNASERAI